MSRLQLKLFYIKVTDVVGGLSKNFLSRNFSGRSLGGKGVLLAVYIDWLVDYVDQ